MCCEASLGRVALLECIALIYVQIFPIFNVQYFPMGRGCLGVRLLQCIIPYSWGVGCPGIYNRIVARNVWTGRIFLMRYPHAKMGILKRRATIRCVPPKKNNQQIPFLVSKNSSNNNISNSNGGGKNIDKFRGASLRGELWGNWVFFPCSFFS